MRPVSKAIVKRREYINSVTNDYDRYQAEAVSLRTQAESIRAAARREAEAYMAKARAEASNEAAQISAEYGQRSAAIIEEAQRTVAAELEAARTSQPQLVNDLANMMVERTITEKAS
jgi:F0F1-type ATP synthase membrane subunit b/b'